MTISTTWSAEVPPKRFLPLLLLSVQGILLSYLGWTMSPTPTEVGHMGASVYWWNTFSFDVFCVNPPLTRIVAGLPVVLSNPNYDWSGYSTQARERPEWALGTAFIAANSPEKNRWCFTLARWSLVPFLLLGGWFGHRLSRDIYGDAAGLVFLILWCFSPLLLGWGATICPDAAAASLGMVAIYLFRRWLRKPEWMAAIGAGVSLGLLPLAKLTWIIALVLWPLIWWFWVLPNYLARDKHLSMSTAPLRQMVVILCVALYTLNTGYLFGGTFRPLGSYAFCSQLLSGRQFNESKGGSVTDNRFENSGLAFVPVPLPADLIQGIDLQRYDFERGLPSYLREQWSENGWWYYYLYLLAIRLPVGMLCLLGVATGMSFFLRSVPSCWRDEMVVLLPCVAILVVVSSQSGFSGHPRYVLPALPLLFVWISKTGQLLHIPERMSRRSVMTVVVLVSLIWTAASSLWVYPHSLSYFNELVGGPSNGPRHLLGSNTDWGQDLFGLEKWCQRHPEARPIHVSYWGCYPLQMTTIASSGPPPRVIASLDNSSNQELVSQIEAIPLGYYALSVNELYAQSSGYSYLLNITPVAVIGYSIYVYHITREERGRIADSVKTRPRKAALVRGRWCSIEGGLQTLVAAGRSIIIWVCMMRSQWACLAAR